MHTFLTKCTQTDLLDIFTGCKSTKPAPNNSGRERVGKANSWTHASYTEHISVDLILSVCRDAGFSRQAKKSSSVSCNISSPEDGTSSVTSNYRIHPAFGQVPVFPAWTAGY